MLTIAPRPWPSIARPSAWHARKTPVAFTSYIRCHCARLSSVAGAALAMPAEFTASDNGPYAASTSPTARVASSGTVTSQLIATPTPPTSAIRAKVSVESLLERSAQPTLAPASASAMAMACPIPRGTGDDRDVTGDAAVHEGHQSLAALQIT